MPNYLVIRAAEMPQPGQVLAATIVVENVPATDSATEQRAAVKQALIDMKESNPNGGVVGVDLASNITRRTFTPTGPPDFTVS